MGLDAVRFLLEHDLSGGELERMPEYDREILGQWRLGASFPKRLLLALNDPFYRASIRINANIMALRESSTRG